MCEKERIRLGIQSFETVMRRVLAGKRVAHHGRKRHGAGREGGGSGDDDGNDDFNGGMHNDLLGFRSHYNPCFSREIAHQLQIWTGVGQVGHEGYSRSGKALSVLTAQAQGGSERDAVQANPSVLGVQGVDAEQFGAPIWEKEKGEPLWDSPVILTTRRTRWSWWPSGPDGSRAWQR